MRGYFALGAEGINKPMNLGNLVRSAHAFGAAFVFFVNSHYSHSRSKSDTSLSDLEIPLYDSTTIDDVPWPRGISIIGVELLDEAITLPTFRHPRRAAYILGPERGSLSEATLQKCDYIVQIPTAFCINVAIAGAIVMYDRMISLGRFAERPVKSGGPFHNPKAHLHGAPKFRTS